MRLRRVIAALDGRTGVAALFVVALAAYWLEALAWPLQRGRDSWDYWLYYLQLLDHHPPFSAVMVFRTPVAPIVTGLPMQIGGAHLLEVVVSFIYAAAVVGWAWAARPFGRVTALLTAVVVLALLPYAAMFHEVSSDFIFGALLAPWCGLIVRAVLRPTRSALAGVGLLTAALTLTRPAGQVLVLAAAAVPLVAPGSWRARGKGLWIAVAAALVPLAIWSGVNSMRYDDFTVARGGKAWVPFYKVLSLRDIDPANGPASRRLAALIERDILTLPQYRKLHVDLHTYLLAAGNLEAIRLIALSDRDFGWSSNYNVLYDTAWETIRHHPGTYAHSVEDTFWHFLWFRFALEPVRRAPPPPPGPGVFTVDGKPAPSPEALSPVAQAARYGFVWCPTNAIDRCIFRDPSVVFHSPAQQRRYRQLVDRVRDWNSQLPLRNGVRALEGKANTLSWHEPAPFFWVVLAIVGIIFRRPRGWPALVVIGVGAALVLFVHALSQQPQTEFSIPLTPVFVLAAVAAARGSATVHES
ncbi:MAG: hypothetical protein E6G32_05430 [Actinobacteria bacterium]|nr:MAG: hypothetical protein E6G32_05430 [Actinomycetota bacterium]